MKTRRKFLLGGAAAALCACAPRAELHWGQGPVGTKIEHVFVATLREMRTAEGTWSDALTQKITFGQFDVNIPPGHRSGSIELPKNSEAYDAAQHFTVAKVQRFQSDAHFVSILRALPRAQRREAIVYIHGFNNTFAESLYSAAQLVHDMAQNANGSELALLNVHYAWPSHGRALGYVADRDRSILARDGLYEMLKALETAGVERIYLMPHSMGCALTMDVLRDIALRKDHSLHRRIGGVFLLSPDVNLNIFRNQARHYSTTFGDLPQPFTVFSSGKDRLLSISALLTGQPSRLGNTTDFSSLTQEFKITTISTDGSSPGGHSDVQTNPSLQRLINSAITATSTLSAQDTARRDLLDYAAMGIQNAAVTLLNPYGTPSD